MSEQVSQTENTFTVSTLAVVLTQALSEFFPSSVTLEAEISNFKTYPSGHWYFSVTDGDASLSAVMFKGSNRLVHLVATNGLKVRIRCEVNFYPPNGRLQLIVKQMIEAGEGDQKAKLEALKARFIAEGLTALSRKQTLPKMPRSIGLITSPKGSVIRDMLTVLGRRWPIASVRLYSAAVQGEQAPLELLRALTRAIQEDSVDVLIIGRGGGASEDLSAFNDDQLCRAIAACPIPIISAVGHETDSGLTDLIADVRAATPSQAAELASPDLQDISRRLIQCQDRLISRADTLNALGQQRLELISNKLWNSTSKFTSRSRERIYQLEKKLVPPTEYIAIKRSDVQHIRNQLIQSIDHKFNALLTRVGHMTSQLDTLSPLATLGRGYGILLKADVESERSIGSVADVGIRSPIEIRLKDGTLKATINKILKEPT